MVNTVQAMVDELTREGGEASRAKCREAGKGASQRSDSIKTKSHFVAGEILFSLDAVSCDSFFYIFDVPPSYAPPSPCFAPES